LLFDLDENSWSIRENNNNFNSIISIVYLRTLTYRVHTILTDLDWIMFFGCFFSSFYSFLRANFYRFRCVNSVGVRWSNTLFWTPHNARVRSVGVCMRIYLYTIEYVCVYIYSRMKQKGRVDRLWRRRIVCSNPARRALSTATDTRSAGSRDRARMVFSARFRA
jgi:hypothetical protein